MFGFAHPSIAKLIQEMPGADLCDKYIQQQFVPSSAKLFSKDEASPVPVRRSGSAQQLEPKSKSKKKPPKVREYESDTDSENDSLMSNHRNMIEMRNQKDDDKKEFEAEDAYDFKEGDHRPTSRSQMLSQERLDEPISRSMQSSNQHPPNQAHSMQQMKHNSNSNWNHALHVMAGDEEEEVEESGGAAW